jgi:hypothetical protein
LLERELKSIQTDYLQTSRGSRIERQVSVVGVGAASDEVARLISVDRQKVLAVVV